MEKICPYSGRTCSYTCARYDLERKQCVDLSVSDALHSIEDYLSYGH